MNKRPDGLSRSVAVRNVKGGRREGKGGCGERGMGGSQTGNRTVVSVAKVRRQEMGRERAREARRQSVDVGWVGEVGQVWERRGGVSSHRSSSSVSVPHEPLPLFGEQKKVVLKSESAPAA